MAMAKVEKINMIAISFYFSGNCVSQTRAKNFFWLDGVVLLHQLVQLNMAMIMISLKDASLNMAMVENVNMIGIVFFFRKSSPTNSAKELDGNVLLHKVVQ